ncbi:MAG: hypothetical protein FD180_3905 [Planctomycetota bacterium]|nr:MAG: hypothetical protein FD180_3905 [Planctomycetota bacterium]
MNAPRLAALAALALAVGLAAWAEDEKPKGPSDKVKAWMGGDRPVGIIAGVTRVECFRVNPEKPREAMGKECGGYPIISTGKEQKREFGLKIAAIVFDEKTYDWEKAKKCEFAPGVGFRLWRDKDWVDVVLCFSCDEFEISTIPPGEKERKSAHEDFDASRAALVKLCKEAFPEDKEILGLKDKREDK